MHEDTVLSTDPHVPSQLKPPSVYSDGKIQTLGFRNYGFPLQSCHLRSKSVADGRKLDISRVEIFCLQQEALLKVQIIYKPKECRGSTDASDLKTRRYLKPAVVNHTCNLSLLGRLRQEDCYEFKNSLS